MLYESQARFPRMLDKVLIKPHRLSASDSTDPSRVLSLARACRPAPWSRDRPKVDPESVRPSTRRAAPARALVHSPNIPATAPTTARDIKGGRSLPPDLWWPPAPADLNLPAAGRWARTTAGHSPRPASALSRPALAPSRAAPRAPTAWTGGWARRDRAPWTRSTAPRRRPSSRRKDPSAGNPCRARPTERLVSHLSLGRRADPLAIFSLSYLVMTENNPADEPGAVTRCFSPFTSRHSLTNVSGRLWQLFFCPLFCRHLLHLYLPDASQPFGPTASSRHVKKPVKFLSWRFCLEPFSDGSILYRYCFFYKECGILFSFSFCLFSFLGHIRPGAPKISPWVIPLTSQSLCRRGISFRCIRRPVVIEVWLVWWFSFFYSLMSNSARQAVRISVGLGGLGRGSMEER